MMAAAAITKFASVTALSQNQAIGSSSLHRHRNRGSERSRRLRVDALLDDVTEMADQPLHRPGRGIAEGADGVAFDLIAHFEQHIDFPLLGLAFGHALEHAPHPPGALPAGCALSARFMLIEV